jgi:hypothetical protein
MKKSNSKKTLNIDKEIIAVLGSKQLKSIEGGIDLCVTSRRYSDDCPICHLAPKGM